MIPRPMSDVFRRTSAPVPAADLVPAPPQGAAPEAGVAPLPVTAAARQREATRRLLQLMLVLALPVLAEHLLHMMVGLNDTWLANHVVRITPGMASADVEAAHKEMTAAAAAVGTISYVLWLIGLITGAISAGSTAIIARATGAR